jgi:hypothetical protein
MYPTKMFLSKDCRGANRRNRYTENPPNCMGGIREFNCACLIVSLVLALLLNTSTQLHCCVLFAWSLQDKINYCRNFEES